eukprot:scaffold38396_cov65-Phaeocystis_antarctica.AAC.3
MKETHSARFEARSQGVGQSASRDSSHETGGAVVARVFPACRKEGEYAAGTERGRPQAGERAGARTAGSPGRACPCQTPTVAWFGSGRPSV